jgi:hypothetical protein
MDGLFDFRLAIFLHRYDKFLGNITDHLFSTISITLKTCADIAVKPVFQPNPTTS